MAVRAFRRIHVSNVCASSAPARSAAHGTSSGTCAARRSKRACACPMSASTSGPRLGRHPVTDLLVSHVHQMLPGVVRGERLEPELGGELGHAELGRSDPLSAELHDGAVRQLVVEDSATDPVAGLEHHDLLARSGKLARCDQARDPGADDRHLGLNAFRQISSSAPSQAPALRRQTAKPPPPARQRT